MIEGLKLDVTARELKEHCEKKVREHAATIETNEQRIGSLRDAGISETPTAGTSVQNPIEGLRSSIKRHRSQAEFFGFIADHIVPTETYRFEDIELQRLEFISSRAY